MQIWQMKSNSQHIHMYLVLLVLRILQPEYFCKHHSKILILQHGQDLIVKNIYKDSCSSSTLQDGHNDSHSNAENKIRFEMVRQGARSTVGAGTYSIPPHMGKYKMQPCKTSKNKLLSQTSQRVQTKFTSGSLKLCVTKMSNLVINKSKIIFWVRGTIETA